jgi:LysM repeat protein
MIHTIKRGETLARIAVRYGVTWQSIATANRLANPNLIRVGQQLTIPPRSSWASDPANPAVWVPRDNPFIAAGGGNQTQNNNQTTSNETTDAATLAALAAAKKKKADEQKQLMIFGGIGLLLVLVLTKK